MYTHAKRALWDQNLINDALESSVYGGDVRRRQWARWLSRGGSASYWRHVAQRVPGVSAAEPAWPHEWEGMAWAPLVRVALASACTCDSARRHGASRCSVVLAPSDRWRHGATADEASQHPVAPSRRRRR